jgi:hypothetical protein
MWARFVGVCIYSSIGAQVEFCCVLESISISICLTLRCRRDSLIQPEHIVLLLAHSMGRLKMPFARRSLHLFAWHTCGRVVVAGMFALVVDVRVRGVLSSWEAYWVLSSVLLFC